MLNVMQVKPGERLQLVGGIVAEVTQNMEDGMWLEVKYLQAKNANDVGLVELCHAQDIIALLAEPEGS